MFTNRRAIFAGGAPALCAALTCAAAAECPPVTFENLAAGTAVTTQYSGVTFSVQPQSCGGSPTLYMRIVTPTGGTSSGTKGIRIDTGCPDFSPDYVRMVFANLQREVSFTVGEGTGTAGWDFDVRYYSDAALLGTLHVESANGVNRLVHVGSAGGLQNIRRIEVDSPIDGHEVLDDLAFDVDTTPPVAQISVPAYEGCVCDSVTVRGMACDPDGAYGSDMLEYRAVDADLGEAWTLIDSATVPQCTSGGVLYSWNTAAVPHGIYYLRMTVENACGLTATAVTVAYVDKLFDTVTLRSPLSGDVVGRTVCLDGTVWDHLCFEQYTADYRPSGGGAWTPVDAVHPTYPTTITTDPLANWKTHTLGLADGTYELRVVGTDVCDNTTTVTRTVVVDNTAPLAVISSPADCAAVEGTVQIIGTAWDANLAGWQLQYAGATGVWVTIASSSTPVVNGVLGSLNTSALPPCGYALRLIVTDKAQLDCNKALAHQSEDIVCVDVGSCIGDVDGDGDVDQGDLAGLLANYGTTCP